ncbi:MAG: tautomerase family protein [Fibrobacterota bacterium]|nr:tautomerase family protein [Fibrobacterota bacterium]QQS07497.1 MAG: tautomerase family protein [Fibrobacterota bacterium]
MPIVHISLTDRWSSIEARAISDAIHQALVEAFRIPDHDYIHRVHRCDAEELILAPGKSDRFVLVEMTIFPGRSAQAKEALYARIATSLESFGIAAADILVALHELPMGDWGLRGQSGDKVQLGFSTQV